MDVRMIVTIVGLALPVLIFIVVLAASHKFRDALTKTAYMSTGEFSVTRIVMVAIAASGIVLIWVGIGASLIWDKVLPNNIYTYVGGMMGTSIVQYGVTKFFRNGKSGESCEDQPGPVDLPVAVVTEGQQKKEG